MATRDVLLVRRPDTGTWDLVRGPDGNPTPDYSAQHAVLTQLLERRGAPGHPGWVWDSAAGSGTPGRHGSLLYRIEHDTPEDRSLFVAYCTDALQILVEEGRIRDLVVEVAPSTTGRLDGWIRWEVPQLGQQEIFIPLMAV